MQTQEPGTQPLSTEQSVREQLIQETEEISDELLREVLDFLLFIKTRQVTRTEKLIASKAPFSSAKYVLDNLSDIGTWEGDDFEECLQMVKDTRSQVDFFKHEPF
ncbi:hypothetical protein [Leptolyngbya sp. NIES-2104]|uniref:hypothetical protein n=1 Tax=Leptolyngbya sp. NIES-2104 TaxID=1552121 RepID=UPI0006ECAEC3|nr:hypothetical protein [Leptolyngbya sp. NIES-2104]GAP97542.1 hypothetical protein NIES2104_40890 [Leptolyngbya sp. NIES-2104]